MVTPTTILRRCEVLAFLMKHPNSTGKEIGRHPDIFLQQSTVDKTLRELRCEHLIEGRVRQQERFMPSEHWVTREGEEWLKINSADLEKRLRRLLQP